MIVALMSVAASTAFAGDSPALKTILKAKTYAEAKSLLDSTLGQLASPAEKAKAYNKLYTLALSQLKDGRIVITEDLQFHANSHGMTHIYTEEDGKNILYWYCVSAPLQYVHDGKVIGKSGWAAMDSLDRPDELRQGTPKDYITIWKKGDVVPAASDEMETYFALEDQVFGKNDVPSVEEGLWARMDKLRDTVPEWQ